MSELAASSGELEDAVVRLGRPPGVAAWTVPKRGCGTRPMG